MPAPIPWSGTAVRPLPIRSPGRWRPAIPSYIGPPGTSAAHSEGSAAPPGTW